MFTKLNATALVGLECRPVDVEVDMSKGQTAFTIVGLPDTSIHEAKDRIHSALKNSGFAYPFNFRIVVNLAPAELHKEGSAYDLPMAVGIVLLANNLPSKVTDTLMVGELALDGTVRHTNGILPLALYARQHGLQKLIVPAADAAEAALVDGVEVYAVESLKQVIDHLTGTQLLIPYCLPANEHNEPPIHELDMAFIKGQEFAKRALEIAASGAHNILMSGPPGSGKTLLARTLPSILPQLIVEEILEITKIYSVAGLLDNSGRMQGRPFRSPHHTASGIALVGGGKYPRPGEISLAHRGVLFLDEFPEFPRVVLESLRQPLEDGVITVSRAQGAVRFPARFILVASQNPCPCGFATDPDKPCVCSASQMVRYQKKISGPLLDRIDLHVEVPRLHFEKLSDYSLAESSHNIRARVAEARERQHNRFQSMAITTNSEMGNAEIQRFCKLDDTTIDLLKTAVTQMRLSARAYNRILKVSRTIADLAKSDTIQLQHVAEALQYRTKID